MKMSKVVLLFASAATSFAALAAPRGALEGESEQAMKVLQGGGSMVIRRQAEAPVANYPDTIAGLMARAFMEAFNSGDPQQVRVAAEMYRSESALESRSMDERLEQYEQLYKDWGRLEVQGFKEHDDGSLTLTVKPDRGYSGLSMTFAFEKAGGKIDEIRITPAMLADESNDPANRGAVGDVTILSESLKPLREYFNANKAKPRFIAILSPT